MRTRLILALLFGLGALVLAGLRWGRLAGPRAGPAARAEAPQGPLRSSAGPQAPLAAATSAAALPSASDPAVPRREPAAATGPRRPIRGRLVDEPGGAPHEVVRLVVLASPGDRVAEVLRTGGDGTFTTVRAFPRGVVRVWVRAADTRALLARHEAPFDPETDGAWLVPVSCARPADSTPAERVEAELHGRVVTLGGQPLEGALVKALALEGSRASVTDTTDGRGEFRLSGLEPERHRVLAQGSFAASAPLELALEEGENEAGTLVLPVEDSPGPIRGRLVAEPGGDDPFGVLLLRDPRSGRELAVPSRFELFAGEDDGQTTFEILGVPPGAYELSVVTVDGRRYEPAVQRVQPPCEDVEFRAREAQGFGYVLAVRDRRTGAPIEPSIALGRTHGQWWGFEDDEPGFARGFDRWVVYAPGYRSARGDFAGAVPIGADDEGIEQARVDVELEPGYAAALLFKDAEGTRLVAPEFGAYFGDGLAGVQVLADGEPVAESDAEGLALVDLPRAPARLDFGRPGWRVAGEREEDGIRFLHMIRE